MASKTTLANQWFGKSSSPVAMGSGISNQTLSLQADQAKFDPTKFLVPGWRGKSLTSKSGLLIQKILDQILKDVAGQLGSCPNFNQSLKQAIYDEFLSYADWATLHFNSLEHAKSFWSHLHSEQSPHRVHLDAFLQIYNMRVAAIYFLKTRFLSTLCQSSGRDLQKVDLLNPNSLITQIFKKSSSTHLPCESLKANQYSWYRPSHELVNELFGLLRETQDVELSELLKILATQPHMQPTSGQYSHTLSNQNFGVFLKHLLVDLPRWTGEPVGIRPTADEPLTCKLTGDYLSSIASSLWDEMRNNTSMQSKSLYPVFYAEDFNHGLFFKHCAELQYLTLLACKATQANISAVNFICKTANSAQNKLNSQTGSGQISMFPELNSVPDPRYDRIVLNLTEFPKNNPHFHMLHKLNSQLKFLSDKGTLVVLSTKKLFVPSQSEKVEQLLKQIKLEACFTLNNLKGKGELGSYIYIFSKNQASDLATNETSSFLNNSSAAGLKLMKHPCFNFRIRGELSTFHQFSTIIQELSMFLNSRTKDSTPLFQKDLKNGVIFEFFKDAIVDGRLINSTSKDPSSITHPNFFKNLMNSSVPFGHFFSTESLTSKEIYRPTTRFSPDWLGVSLKNSSNYSAVLVIDMRSSNAVRLEVIDVDAYKAKSEEYGFALCSYFGLVPKLREVNLNLFREFFNSDIGVQIIQLCLSGGPQKLKSKLQALLIPKFFIKPEPFPEQVQPHLEFLSYSIEKLLSMTPEQLLQRYERSQQCVEMLFNKYPWRVLSVLSQFKNNVQLCLAKLETSNTSVTSQFHNPQVIEKLRKLKCHKIYPHNTDFYIEFNHRSTQELYQPMHGIQFKTNQQDGHTNSYLELDNGQNPVLRIFSDADILKFMLFILKNTQGMPIAHILQNLDLPKLEDFNRVMSECLDLGKTFESLHTNCQNIITQNIRNQIHLNQTL